MTGYIIPSMGSIFKESYIDLKSWYHQPCRFSSSTPYGKLEIAGRYISVSTAHLTNACLSLTIGIAYETALAILFFTLDTLTFSQSEFINRNYIRLGFSSIFLMPTLIASHALAGISPSFAYSFDSYFLLDRIDIPGSLGTRVYVLVCLVANCLFAIGNFRDIAQLINQ
jgi:hypothetical protein